jgi:beta-lactamase regulating signal transducer with metallopeptidase domain
METLVKADIFFFISSVATVVLAILISALLFYLIKAGKNLYMISEALKSNFKESEEFVSELKERLDGNIIFRLFFPMLRKKR